MINQWPWATFTCGEASLRKG